MFFLRVARCQYAGRWVAACALLLVLAASGCDRLFPGSSSPPATEGYYEFKPSESPDGSGKFYMGREIARVHDTPDTPQWLERPGREREELPDRVIQALELSPSDVIADIGAGTGYFSFRISPHVPQGKVYAVDIQPEMLDMIRRRMRDEGVDNIEPVLGTVTDPHLPENSVDVAIIVSSYHEFSHPREMMEHIVRALKPGGRFVLVEYRGEDDTIPVSPLRRMTEDQAIKEMRVVGLRWKTTRDILPQQHFIVFEKPAR